jgi:ribosomal protein S5
MFCRAAQRNLIHIDLYDNFGLAHDCFGKYNGCYVYITATPASREIVGSYMAREILHRMGIGSCSVKIIGNRNPYAVVNAITKALSQHKNIDELAKMRGKRYLTLRWAHDHSM